MSFLALSKGIYIVSGPEVVHNFNNILKISSYECLLLLVFEIVDIIGYIYGVYFEA